MPALPSPTVKLPDCQQNWDFISKPAPAIILHSNTTQSINNAAITQITGYTSFQLKRGDITGSLASGIVTINIPGLYFMYGQVYWNVVAGGGFRSLWVGKTSLADADPLGARQEQIMTIANQEAPINVSCFQYLVRGDTISLFGYQTSGAAMTIGFATNNAVQTKLGVVKVGN